MRQSGPIADHHPCTRCHTRCCKDYVVYVNSHDIYRIHKAFLFSPQSFLQLYKSEDESSGVILQRGIYDLALKDRYGVCTFLVEKEGQFRCRTHEFKPGICRSYPFELRRGRVVQLSEKVCPVDWKLLKDSKEELLIQLRTYDKEWDFHHQITKEWNSRLGHRTLRSFVRFALDRVEKSLPV